MGDPATLVEATASPVNAAPPAAAATTGLQGETVRLGSEGLYMAALARGHCVARLLWSHWASRILTNGKSTTNCFSD